MDSQDIKAIDNLVIKDIQKPGYCDFYIQWYTEDIDYLTKQNIEYEQDIGFFKKLKTRNVSNSELVSLFLEPINILQKYIDKNMQKIECNKKLVDKFVKCRDGYIQDFKNGLYYDKENGELINEEPSKVVPDDAYVPKELR